MKKRLFTLILALALCLCCAFPAMADNFDNKRIVDEAGLLTDTQREELSGVLDEISDRQQLDIIVVTSNDLRGCDTATECADEFYDQNGYGCGENKDGILLLISMADRDWAISTSGRAVGAFTDYGCDYIADKIMPDLSESDYAAAFTCFAELCDDFITQADAGEPLDYPTDSRSGKEPLSLKWIPISIVIGVVIALIVVACMKAKLKTVRFQPAASNYVKSGSMNLTGSSDLYLYSTVSRTERPKDNDSGGGGGSHVHMSSSGSMHGGRSGKF